MKQSAVTFTISSLLFAGSCLGQVSGGKPATEASQAPTIAKECDSGEGKKVCTVVLEVDKGYRTANAAAIATHYAPDAVWINAVGIEWHGPEAIRKFLARLLASPTITGSVDSPLHIRSVQFPHPDVAVVVSYLETTDQKQEGTNKPLPVRKTREMQVLSIHEGRWLIDSDLIADEDDNL